MRARRLEQLPPYLFVELDRSKERRRKAGAKLLDLGIGDPDIGAPPELMRALFEAVSSGKHDRYPPDRGLPVLIEAICEWARRTQGASLGQEEILVTIGSKEAIGHLGLALLDPGDAVIVPDPCYPVYRSSAVLAGADIVSVPLDGDAGWQPKLDILNKADMDHARLLFLNFPNNPTGAVATAELYKRCIAFAKETGLVLAADSAYCEIWYDEPQQLLFPVARQSQIPYIEFFSFSKTFSVTGWRIGFAVGSPEVISSLAQLKNNLDSGVFGAIQQAVASLLDGSFESITDSIRKVYRCRRDLLAEHLSRSGLKFELPKATFYFWIRTPDGMGSIEFCRYLLEELGIVATPGLGFGQNGEGYFRLSITAAAETIDEAGRRLESIGERFERV